MGPCNILFVCVHQFYVVKNTVLYFELLLHENLVCVLQFTECCN